MQKITGSKLDALRSTLASKGGPFPTDTPPLIYDSGQSYIHSLGFNEPLQCMRTVKTNMITISNTGGTCHFEGRLSVISGVRCILWLTRRSIRLYPPSRDACASQYYCNQS